MANFHALHLRGRFPGEHLHGDWFLPLHYDLWGASWYFVPVLLTGVALILMLVFQMPRWWGTLILGILSFAVVGICLVGYLGFGIAYVPSALAMLVATVLSVRRPRTD